MSSLLPLVLAALGAPEDAAPAAFALPEPTEAALRVDAAVSADELLGHAAYLADDALGGRFTGTPGADAAAAYLAARLEALRPHGLEPAGDDGTFLQDVRLDTVSFERLPEVRLDGEPLVYGPDVELRRGHGVDAELEVLVVADAAAAPAEPDPTKALYLDLSTAARRDLVEARGEAWEAGWGAVVVKGFTRGRRVVEDATRLRRVRSGAPELVVHGATRDRLAAGEVERLTLSLGGKVSKAHNVVAVLPGAGRDAGLMGPGLEDRVNPAVVLSAHYDHLRPLPVDPEDPDADRIFNGADDDASGVAVVLEVVEAMCLADERPERDLVVLLATGEEIGLVGTTFYLDHPAVPLEHTVLNLNFEMLGRPDELVGGPGKLWLTGHELTNLGPDLQAAGLDVVRDPRPSQHFFERSDNYAFVLKGVVGQTLSSYGLHDDYHRVTDEAGTLDGAHLEAAARIGVAATALVLAADVTVAWVEGYRPPRR